MKQLQIRLISNRAELHKQQLERAYLVILIHKSQIQQHDNWNPADAIDCQEINQGTFISQKRQIQSNTKPQSTREGDYETLQKQNTNPE